MYLDSAILVKLVVREPDSDFYADLVSGRRHVRASEIAVAECRSALLRKRHQDAIDTRTAQGAWERLQAFWSGGDLALVPVDRAILLEAGELIDRCLKWTPLRTLDAIHIATCRQAHAEPLVTNDQVMRAASERLGVALGPIP